jgi:hypothetical protein
MLEEAQGYSSQAASPPRSGSSATRARSIRSSRCSKSKEITRLARGFAAVALGIVADKEPLPVVLEDLHEHQLPANTTTLTSQEATGILNIL